MRGSDMRTGELFSYVDLEKRVPEHHPLRLIRRIVNEVLAELDREFAELYAAEGRPSIAPERKVIDEMCPSPVARRLRMNRRDPSGRPDWSGCQTIDGLNRAADSSAYSWVK